MMLDLTPAQTTLVDAAASFARQHVLPHAAAIDEHDRVPRELLEQAAAAGLTGLTAPPPEGRGADRAAVALAIEAVSAASATLGTILGIHNLLVLDPLARFGSKEQQAAWVPRLASGAALGAFAYTEPQAGTDASRPATQASLGADGRFTLSGRKAWVSNGEAAGVALVAATVPQQAQRALFVVPLDRPGVGRSVIDRPLGLRGLGCVQLELDGVVLEADAALGGLAGGASVLDYALDRGRVAIAAVATGIGAAALEEATGYARHHESAGQPIGGYQAVQWMLADMATELDAARLLMLKAAAAEGGTAERPMEAAMAVLYAPEAACRITELNMRVLASAAYRRGSRAERLFRDARGTVLMMGTPDRQRLVVSAGLLEKA